MAHTFLSNTLFLETPLPKKSLLQSFRYKFPKGPRRLKKIRKQNRAKIKFLSMQSIARAIQLYLKPNKIFTYERIDLMRIFKREKKNMLKKRNYYRRVKLYGHLFRHRNSYKKRFRYHKTLKKKLANLSFLLFFIFRATISNALFQSAAIIALINSRNLNMNSNIFFNIIKKK